MYIIDRANSIGDLGVYSFLFSICRFLDPAPGAILEPWKNIATLSGYVQPGHETGSVGMSRSDQIQLGFLKLGDPSTHGNAPFLPDIRPWRIGRWADAFWLWWVKSCGGPQMIVTNSSGKHTVRAIENGHRNSWFTHEKGGSFHSYVHVYQRVH